MSTIVKVTEVIAESERGFDDAVQTAVKEVAKTVRGIKSVWVKNLQCEVEGDRIVRYRVNAKVSFVVDAKR